MKTADYIIAEKYAELLLNKIRNKESCDYEELYNLEVAISSLILNHMLPGPKVLELHNEVEALYSYTDCEAVLKDFTKGAIWGALTFWQCYLDNKRQVT